MSTPRIDLDHSIYTANVMVSNELCESMIEVFENKSKLFPESHYTKTSDSIYRKDESMFFDSMYEMDTELDLGDLGLVYQINDYLNTALMEYSEIFPAVNTMQLRSTRQKIQKTQKGGGYHIWHHEQTNLQSMERALVWTIYLNDVEEGGETEFLYQSKRIKAEKGKICIFPAGFTHTHRGNPPLLGDKYICTGWWNIK